MNCPLLREETADVLLDYTAGRLDPSRSALIERHMKGCAACDAFRLEQAAVWHALDVWEPAPVSLDFNRKLWQRIDAQVPWYRSLADALRFGNWKPAAPLAVAILVIAGGFLMDHQGDRVPNSGAVPTIQGVSVQGVSVNEADQLEQTLDDIQMLRQLDSVAAPNGIAKQM
jgi:anti-sigma factor RsiW